MSAATNNQQILLANVNEYLNGFSDNVKEIVNCFNLKAQIRHMAEKQVLLDVIEKFVSPISTLPPTILKTRKATSCPPSATSGWGMCLKS